MDKWPVYLDLFENFTLQKHTHPGGYNFHNSIRAQNSDVLIQFFLDFSVRINYADFIRYLSVRINIYIRVRKNQLPTRAIFSQLEEGKQVTIIAKDLTMQQFSTAKEFGEIIRRERKRQGFTQTQLANYSRVGLTFVSNLENGKPTAELERALRVAQTLGIDFFAKKR